MTGAAGIASVLIDEMGAGAELACAPKPELTARGTAPVRAAASSSPAQDLFCAVAHAGAARVQRQARRSSQARCRDATAGRRLMALPVTAGLAHRNGPGLRQACSRAALCSAWPRYRTRNLVPSPRLRQLPNRCGKQWARPCQWARADHLVMASLGSSLLSAGQPTELPGNARQRRVGLILPGALAVVEDMDARPNCWCYPERCRNGHEWGPGLITVWWVLCDCRPTRAARGAGRGRLGIWRCAAG